MWHYFKKWKIYYSFKDFFLTERLWIWHCSLEFDFTDVFCVLVVIDPNTCAIPVRHVRCWPTTYPALGECFLSCLSGDVRRSCCSCWETGQLWSTLAGDLPANARESNLTDDSTQTDLMQMKPLTFLYGIVFSRCSHSQSHRAATLVCSIKKTHCFWWRLCIDHLVSGLRIPSWGSSAKADRFSS